jgi:hypothetical protein
LSRISLEGLAIKAEGRRDADENEGEPAMQNEKMAPPLRGDRGKSERQKKEESRESKERSNGGRAKEEEERAKKGKEIQERMCGSQSHPVPRRRG